MTDSIIILLAILITANVLLIVLALGRTVQRRRRERDETTARPVATAGRPVSGANGTAASVDRGPAATAGTVAADARATPPRTDPLTGLLRQAEWDRILIDEAARIDRYGRPATVVFIDVEGLDKLTSVLGPAAGDRILPALAERPRAPGPWLRPRRAARARSFRRPADRDRRGRGRELRGTGPVGL